jgi:hypothetical protein
MMVKVPLSSLHAITLTNPPDLHVLYTTLAERFDFPRAPSRDFAQLAAEVPVLEEAAPLPDEQPMEVQMIARDRDIRLRLRNALETGQRWRTIGRVAVAAAVSEDTALDILRADDHVRFSRGKHGDLIVGLTSRVGT